MDAKSKLRSIIAKSKIQTAAFGQKERINPKSKRPRLDFGSWTAGTGHVTNEDVWPGTRIWRSW